MLSLQCHENCNAASEDSRTPTPEMSSEQTNAPRPVIFRTVQATPPPPPVDFTLQNSNLLGIGDLIWGHQKGYSAWPGKIVSGPDVGESPATEGNVSILLVCLFACFCFVLFLLFYFILLLLFVCLFALFVCLFVCFFILFFCCCLLVCLFVCLLFYFILLLLFVCLLCLCVCLFVFLFSMLCCH